MRLQFAMGEDEHGPYLRVLCRDGRAFLIDAIDHPFLGEHDWKVIRGGSDHCLYVARGRNILLHRELMDAPKGMTVDHRDGDGLNDRRYNMRLATRHQNNCNRVFPSRGHSSSGYRGVYLRAGRWEVLITINCRQVYLGRFDTAEEAARVWDAAAYRERGEFAVLNFPHAKSI